MTELRFTVPEMYQSLASVYDEIQSIDYAVWADFICRLDKRYNRRGQTGDGQSGRPILLDLGCGTGGFCLEMAKCGYDPIGIDRSAAMLSQARGKLQDDYPPDAANCLFLQQDISRFELYGTVDLIVCLLDTVNHLVRQDAVRRLFRLCNHYLNPGGILVFDLATWHHLSETLGSNFFYTDQPAYTLFWQHHFSPASGMARTELTLFLMSADGSYRRSDEQIRERYYAAADIERFMAETSLVPAAKLDDRRMRQPAAAEQRTFHVYRKADSTKLQRKR